MPETDLQLLPHSPHRSHSHSHSVAYSHPPVHGHRASHHTAAIALSISYVVYRCGITKIASNVRTLPCAGLSSRRLPMSDGVLVASRQYRPCLHRCGSAMKLNCFRLERASPRAACNDAVRRTKVPPTHSLYLQACLHGQDGLNLPHISCWGTRSEKQIVKSYLFNDLPRQVRPDDLTLLQPLPSAHQHC